MAGEQLCKQLVWSGEVEEQVEGVQKPTPEDRTSRREGDVLDGHLFCSQEEPSKVATRGEGKKERVT